MKEFVWKPIEPGELSLGKPAPFDCYSPSMSLLLRKGAVISSQHQLDRIIASGMRAAEDESPLQPKQNKSPFEILDELKNRLQKIFADFYEEQPPNKPKNLQARVISLCKDIQELCELNADAALGGLHLDFSGRYTVSHPIYVAILCELTGQHKNIPAEQRLSILAAALTCNISILKLQESLHRQDEPLTPGQKELIRIHPATSVDMLNANGISDDLWINTVLFHHEKIDGSGYPGALSGDKVPLPVRMLSLADTYSAMVSNRSYRNSFLAQEAMRSIFLKRGSEVDADLAQLFIKEISIYPPGAFVKLENGETAVVIRRGTPPTSPLVKSVIDPDGKRYKTPIQQDCSVKETAVKTVVPRIMTVPLHLETLWDYAYEP